jgi:hypothetical protein
MTQWLTGSREDSRERHVTDTLLQALRALA